MTEKLLDFEGLLKRAMNDKELVKEILLCYLEETPLTLNTLAHYVKLQDYEKIKEDIHVLKGSSASVGAIKITEISIKIQHAVIDKDIIAISKAMKDLNKEYNKILKTIKSLDIME